MKKSVAILMMIFSQILLGQNVILNKVVKTHSNSDKIFYKINPELGNSEYLAELEVQGFSDDDAKVFGMIYKKAKEVGANAFSYQPFETIEEVGTEKFDPAHYKLNLYYVNPENFPKENNVVYFFASPYKKQNIALNNENIVFEPRTFTKKTLNLGEVFSVSTKKFLGSSIKLAGQENQPVQYFQFSSFSVNSNPYGTAGINLKSGDITKLERSYADFLSVIYQEVK